MPTVQEGQTILLATNTELVSKVHQLEAQRDQEIVRMNTLFITDPVKGGGPGAAMIYKISVEALQAEIDDTKKRIKDLELISPQTGVLVADELEHRNGNTLRHEKLGMVADMDMERLIIRAWVPNDLAGMVSKEAKERVEIRVLGRPDILLEGRISYMAPEGQDRLPSAALGYGVGGATETDREDRYGTKATENGLEVRIDRLRFINAPDNIHQLMPGQRVVVRFDFVRKPYLYQGWTSLQQLFQKKFHG